MVAVQAKKKNFENRFINSKANVDVDYVRGGGGEVRLNCAYLGLFAYD